MDMDLDDKEHNYGSRRGGEAGDFQREDEVEAQDKEVEEVTPTRPPPVSVSLADEDDDEVKILEGEGYVASTPTKVVNPLHHKETEPECIDLTEDDDGSQAEEDQRMTLDDADDVILDESDQDIAEVQVPEDEDDDDVPILLECPKITTRDQAELNKTFGNKLFKDAQYNQALDAYTRAIELMPKEPTYYGNRSACYMMMNRYQEALTDILVAVNLDNFYDKGHLRLIRIYNALGNVAACEAAIAQYKKLGLKTDIADEERKFTTIKNWKTDLENTMARGDSRRVVYVCDQLIQLIPVDLGVKTCRGRALLKLGRHEEAGEVAAEVITKDPHNVEAHILRGLCHYQLDNMERSLLFFKAALHRNPDASEPKLLHKKLRQLQEARAKAAEIFRKGTPQESKKAFLDLLPTVTSDDNLKNPCLESKFCFNVSLASFRELNYDEAITYATRAIHLNSKYYKCLVHRATVYKAMGKFDEAVRDYESAIKADPTRQTELRDQIKNTQVEAKLAERKDYYKILQVPKDANKNEIIKAYKKRALEVHPDRHAGASEEKLKECERLFKDVGEAFEVLSDDKKRREHDNPNLYNILNESGGMHDFTNPANFFQYFPGPGTGGGFGGHSYRSGSAPRYYHSSAGGRGCSYGGSFQ